MLVCVSYPINANEVKAVEHALTPNNCAHHARCRDNSCYI